MINLLIILLMFLEPPNPPIPNHVPVQARITYYNPSLGGVNCWQFVKGQCVSKTKSGAKWQDWFGRGLACPKEIPFGTRFWIRNQVWTCVDRGGRIYIESNGVIRLDLLTDTHPWAGRGVFTVYRIK